MTPEMRPPHEPRPPQRHSPRHRPNLSAKSPKITGVLRLSSLPTNTFLKKRDWITPSFAGKAIRWRFHQELDPGSNRGRVGRSAGGRLAMTIGASMQPDRHLL